MKIIKKLLFIPLIACLSVTLFGCGKSKQEKHQEALDDAQQEYNQAVDDLEDQQREYNNLQRDLDELDKEYDALDNAK